MRSSGPSITVGQALELEEWLKQRDRERDGRIKNLEHNLRQVTESRDMWQARYLQEKFFGTRLITRRRLIPVVKFLTRRTERLMHHT